MEYLVEPQGIAQGDWCIHICVEGNGCVKTEVCVPNTEICNGNCEGLCGAQMCDPRMDPMALN